MHLSRRLKLLVGVVLTSCNGDLALFGEDFADGGSNIPSEASLRLDVLYGFEERWDMLERFHPCRP